MARAMDCPDGIDQVTWRRRLRCMSAIGALWLAIAARGSVDSGVEIFVSMRLFRLISPSLKAKNVCHPMKRRGAREPLRRSLGAFPFSGAMSPEGGAKSKPKNGVP